MSCSEDDPTTTHVPDTGSSLLQAKPSPDKDLMGKAKARIRMERRRCH